MMPKDDLKLPSGSDHQSLKSIKSGNNDFDISERIHQMELSDRSEEKSLTSEVSNANKEGLASNETKGVKLLRATVLVVLLGTAAAVCGSAFVITRNSEEQDFKDTYYDQAARVIDAFQANSLKRIAAVENFALTITSHAIFTNSTWPMVTLPDFERRATAASELAEVMSMIMVPLVTDDNRLKWEEYAVDNQIWFEESIVAQQEIELEKKEEEQQRADNAARFRSLQGGRSLQNGDFAIPEEIYRVEGFGVAKENGPGPYLPQWQIAPIVSVPGLVNFNLLSHTGYQDSLHALLETEVAIVGKSLDFSDPNDEATAGRREVFDLFLNNWVEDNVFEKDPIADLFYPVYDSYDRATRTLVGLLTCVVYWRTYFVDILPENANGIVVVLENSCDQQYTYQLNGPRVEYLGTGDRHDKQYDEFEVPTGKGTFLQVDKEARNVDGSCLYSIRVYPSELMESNFVTNQPLLYTVILALIFIFTSGVFIVYDCLVERRQKIVMDTAVASTAIVSSLFPKNVRGRLYGEGSTEMNGQPQRRPSVTPSIMMGMGMSSNASVQSIDESDKGKPIADLFSDCTVLFADIAGFTAWSSSRQPTEVFQLLEALYGALDKIANRRRVFKVETIGDCYLAVTGLPEPQEDHAIIMSVFAIECRRRVRKMVNGMLKQILGPETATLAMRFGLHSGPVTAGVLRGEKSRFQLFGDTVNTAARMESTGMKDKIQLSQQTAELLIEAGKQHWLEERSDLVVAKGKGELQAYWLEIKSRNSSSMADSLDGFSRSSQLSDDDLSEELPAAPATEKTESEFLNGSDSFSSDLEDSGHLKALKESCLIKTND